MNSTAFASTFAPYTPPPDDPSRTLPAAESSTSASGFLKKSPIRPWFPSQEASQYQSQSYQSGALPITGNSFGSAGGGSGGVSLDNEAFGAGPVTEAQRWETRFGTRVDMLAAFAYLFGPISALLCLVIESHNDFVRFHAYQSAMLTTPLVFLRIMGEIIGFPSFLKTLLTLLIIGSQLYMAFRAFVDASRNNLSRFYVPYVGPMAEQFVSEE